MWHPIKHYKTIHHHKMWVMRYCFRCGLYWQGLTHDLSKLAPVEFLAGAAPPGCTTRGATATTWNIGSTTRRTATMPCPACACRAGMWPR